MRTLFFNVGESTSMCAGRPGSCRRGDLDVCGSTCVRIDLYAKRPASRIIIHLRMQIRELKTGGHIVKGDSLPGS